MSLVEGNAWAQMKAKERDQQQPELDRDLTPNTSPTPGTSISDYGCEPAHPMPKSRHNASNEMSSSATRSNVLTKPNVMKKRSTTEPSFSTERTSNSKSEKADKKKSKVATLRSKFSLKDMGREFRKDAPPLSSMLKLGGESSIEARCASSDGETRSKEAPNFNEAKLYVPKTRKNDDGIHPKSAPPQTSEFPDSSLDNSGDSTASCPSMETPRKISEDEQTTATFKHTLVHNTEDSQSTINTHLENLILGGSSPPPRTGECHNTGQPELIQVQNRVTSMKAENKNLALSSSPQTPSLRSFTDTQECSLSEHETPNKVTVDVSKKECKKMMQPFIVHSDIKEKTRQGHADEDRFMDPREPPAIPAPVLPNKSLAREKKTNVVVDEKQAFAGVTKHGGYAPPPPVPGYQNTVTLEQQLASHVDSLHYHVSTAVNKLTRTFENGSNWSTDQIMKRVEDMFTSVGMLEGQTKTQEKAVKELQTQLMSTQSHIVMARHEALLVEERMKAFVHGEMAKLKDELIGLILSTTSVTRAQDQSQDTRSGTCHQGLQVTPRFDRRYQHQNKKKQKQIQPKREETTINSLTDNKSELPGQVQESKIAPAQQAETPVGRAFDQTSPSGGVPTPAAAFRTPKPQTGNRPGQIKREGPADPREELFGSPKKKTSKMPVSKPAPFSAPAVAESSKTPPTPERESASDSCKALNYETLKTPKKKGGMFSGFRRDKDKKGDGDNHSSGYRLQIRTPRRTKETNRKSIGSQEGQQSPHFAIPTHSETHITAENTSITTNTQTTAPVATGTNICREDSPSLVHPALRNPHQKQIMANREQLRLAHINRKLQDPGLKQPVHGHPLRMSQSHQNLGNQESTVSGALASSPPLFVPYEHLSYPGYASEVSMSTASSMSSSHNVRQYLSSMHYTHPPLPQKAEEGQPQYFVPQPVHQHQSSYPPPPNHGHDPGQVDRAGWYGTIFQGANLI